MSASSNPTFAPCCCKPNAKLTDVVDLPTPPFAELTQHALIKRENKSFELTEQGRIVYAYALELEARHHHAIHHFSRDFL